MNRFGALASLFAGATLSACGVAIDVDQARLCRMTIPALAASEAHISVLQQAQIRAPKEAGGTVLRVDYRYERAGEPAGIDFAECTFADTSLAGGRAELVGLRTRDGPLAGWQLMLLRRFWLDTPAAALEDPAPVAGAERAIAVSFTTAYAAQQALNALPLAAIYGLLAAAYSLLYGLIGRVNMAFGEFAAIGGYAALMGVLLAGAAGPLAAIFAACALAGFAAAVHGVAAGRILAPVLRRGHGQQTLIATIGLALALQEYLRLTQGVGLHWVGPIMAQPVALAKADGFVVTVTPAALLTAGVAALAASLLLALLRFSRFGRDWRAYADDPGAAALFGVNPARIVARTFALACALAGLSGAMITLYYGGLGYGASTTLGLKALVAAILGGIGSVGGAFVGGIGIGALEALWSALFPTMYRDVVVYGLLAALLVWRPGGLLGFGDLLPRRV